MAPYCSPRTSGYSLVFSPISYKPRKIPGPRNTHPIRRCRTGIRGDLNGRSGTSARQHRLSREPARTGMLARGTGRAVDADPPWRRGSSRRRRNRSPLLRLWLDRLSDPELLSSYRICREISADQASRSSVRRAPQRNEAPPTARAPPASSDRGTMRGPAARAPPPKLSRQGGRRLFLLAPQWEAERRLARQLDDRWYRGRVLARNP